MTLTEITCPRTSDNHTSVEFDDDLADDLPPGWRAYVGRMLENLTADLRELGREHPGQAVLSLRCRREIDMLRAIAEELRLTGIRL
jgi:hypothetical protein